MKLHFMPILDQMTLPGVSEIMSQILFEHDSEKLSIFLDSIQPDQDVDQVESLLDN